MMPSRRKHHHPKNALVLPIPTRKFCCSVITQTKVDVAARFWQRTPRLIMTMTALMSSWVLVLGDLVWILGSGLGGNTHRRSKAKCLLLTLQLYFALWLGIFLGLFAGQLVWAPTPRLDICA